MRENRVADFVGRAVEVIGAPGVEVFVPRDGVAVNEHDPL